MYYTCTDNSTGTSYAIRIGRVAAVAVCGVWGPAATPRPAAKSSEKAEKKHTLFKKKHTLFKKNIPYFRKKTHPIFENTHNVDFGSAVDNSSCCG